MTDLASLADILLANFRTVPIPAPEPIQTKPGDWFATAKVRLAEKRAVEAFRDRIRRVLADHGYRCLHHLEADPEGGWRLHIFVADDDALALLDEITEGKCGAGDPVTFDADEFLRDRLPDCHWAREW